MKRPRRPTWGLSPALLLVLVAACGPVAGPGPGSGAAPVARVQVEAPVVLINNRPVTGSQPVFIGDDVRTQSTGRARIFFDAGGSLVLGPNTDPLFQLVSDAGCVGTAVLQLLIRTGTFDFFNVTRVCFCVPQDAVCGVPSSNFRVVVTRGRTDITVTSGALRVTVAQPPPRPPARYRVTQGYAMVVERGKTQGPQPILR